MRTNVDRVLAGQIESVGCLIAILANWQWGPEWYVQRHLKVRDTLPHVQLSN
jgi:hypothetical protein